MIGSEPLHCSCALQAYLCPLGSEYGGHCAQLVASGYRMGGAQVGVGELDPGGGVDCSRGLSIHALQGRSVA